MSGSHDEVERTLRAAAEVFVPGLALDPTPGAPDVAAERFVAHYLAYLMPGLAEGTASLLDAVARERFAGRAFAELTLEEREIVLVQIEGHEVAAVRDLPTLLGALATAAVYGEWTGQDADGALVREPVGWELTGFDGPVRARTHLLGDAP